MNLTPDKLFRSDAATPFHEELLHFSSKPKSREGMMHIASVSVEGISAQELLNYQDEKALEKRVREMTIKQLATTLRMQAEENGTITMLNSLESLVLAGEIPSQDFIRRVSNLLPEAMDALDISMRMKVAALMM